MAARKVRLVIRDGVPPGRARALVRWLAALVPAAVLVLAPPTALPDDDDPDTVTVDADQVPSGPLSLADLLARSVKR